MKKSTLAPVLAAALLVAGIGAAITLVTTKPPVSLGASKSNTPPNDEYTFCPAEPEHPIIGCTFIHPAPETCNAPGTAAAEPIVLCTAVDPSVFDQQTSIAHDQRTTLKTLLEDIRKGIPTDTHERGFIYYKLGNGQEYVKESEKYGADWVIVSSSYFHKILQTFSPTLIIFIHTHPPAATGLTQERIREIRAQHGTLPPDTLSLEDLQLDAYDALYASNTSTNIKYMIIDDAGIWGNTMNLDSPFVQLLVRAQDARMRTEADAKAYYYKRFKDGGMTDAEINQMVDAANRIPKNFSLAQTVNMLLNDPATKLITQKAQKIAQEQDKNNAVLVSFNNSNVKIRDGMFCGSPSYEKGLDQTLKALNEKGIQTTYTIHTPTACQNTASQKDGYAIPPLQFGGRATKFGGSDDTKGMAFANDHLGLITKLNQISDPQLFLPGATDNNLFSHLNPEYFYCSMRWHYPDNDDQYHNKAKEFWRNQRILITNPANGRNLTCRPVDKGPGVSEKADIDLSPGAMRYLGGEEKLEGLRASLLQDASSGYGPCL